VRFTTIGVRLIAVMFRRFWRGLCRSGRTCLRPLTANTAVASIQMREGETRSGPPAQDSDSNLHVTFAVILSPAGGISGRSALSDAHAVMVIDHTEAHQPGVCLHATRRRN